MYSLLMWLISENLKKDRGHLLTLAEPENQVDPSLKEKYKSWDPETIPWNLSNLSWRNNYL